MKKRFLATRFAMVMTVSMLVGCGSGEAANTDNTTNEAVEQQGTESEATTENEGTEVETESESADESAAGSEFTNIAFDENEVPHFVNTSYQDTEHMNDTYRAKITNNTEYHASETDLESIVAAMQESWDNYKAELGNGTWADGVENTYELVTIGDYTFIRTTSYTAANEEADMEEYTTVLYELPLQYKGEYVHNNVFSVVALYSNDGTQITEQGVLEALELLY